MDLLGSRKDRHGFTFGDEQKSSKQEKTANSGGASRAKTALMYVLGSTAFAITILVKLAETAG